jgi:predicted site-specific integrase-resolvase
MLDVDRSTLYRWKKRGYLVPIQIGGKVRYKRSEIETKTGGDEK